jgi:hypothetical protein
VRIECRAAAIEPKSRRALSDDNWSGNHRREPEAVLLEQQRLAPAPSDEIG